MPAYDLAEVQRQARTCPTIVVFNEANSVETVSALLDLDTRPARAFILSLIAALTSENYAGPFDAMKPPADVYGVVASGHGWYIKVSLVHGRLSVHSCHPPATPLVTPAGTITRRP